MVAPAGHFDGVRFIQLYHMGWDQHSDLPNQVRSQCRDTDQASAALIKDLKQRGMLDDTLVIWGGEFGRTPTINKDAGRDHWPHAYTTVLAGGGVRGGQVYGSTDSRGAYVAAQPVTPADVLATLWTCLGIDPETELRDRQNRPYVLSSGRPIKELLEEGATVVSDASEKRGAKNASAKRR